MRSRLPDGAGRRSTRPRVLAKADVTAHQNGWVFIRVFGKRAVVKTIDVVGYADLPPNWDWIVSMHRGDPSIGWRMASSLRTPAERRVPVVNPGRVRGALQLRAMLKQQTADMVLSVSPTNSVYAEALALRRFQDIPHFAWGFNFTDLPTGYRLAAMRRHLGKIERFAVFSRMERALYADLFDIPIERFAFTRWAVAAPIETPMPRTIAEPYFIALGGEARDYATFCAAARLLPGTSFVLVARPHSVVGIDIPDNVTLRLDLSWDEAWSLVWHAEASLVPLRSRKTPNGHVTIVGGMHLGKAQVVTDSHGIRDYVTDEDTALLVGVNDPVALARSVEQLSDDADLRRRLGDNAKAFASDNCSEQVTVDFALHHLRDLTRA